MIYLTDCSNSWLFSMVRLLPLLRCGAHGRQKTYRNVADAVLKSFGSVRFALQEAHEDEQALRALAERYGLPAGSSREALHRVLSRLPNLNGNGGGPSASTSSEPFRSGAERDPSPRPPGSPREDGIGEQHAGTSSGESGSLAQLLRSLAIPSGSPTAREGGGGGVQPASRSATPPPQMRRPQSAAEYDRLLMVSELFSA